MKMQVPADPNQLTSPLEQPQPIENLPLGQINRSDKLGVRTRLTPVRTEQRDELERTIVQRQGLRIPLSPPVFCLLSSVFRNHLSPHHCLKLRDNRSALPVLPRPDVNHDPTPDR